jgi:hypothetical protein
MTLLRSSCTGFAAALLLATAARAGTYTVDDDGPADFSSIAVAIASVPSSSVLLVMPGTYDAFFVDRSLSILGPGDGPRPRVLGTTTVSTSLFALAGLSLEHLVVYDVGGPARIDDCFIGDVTAEYDAALDVHNDSQVLVTRSVIDGRSLLPGGGGVPGVRIQGANYALVDCSVFGGDAASAASGECAHASHGAAIMTLSSGLLAASSLVGGHGGISECGGDDSTSGDGLILQQGQHDLRGNTTLSAGPGYLGWDGALGHALDVTGALLVLEPATVGTGGLQQVASTLITAKDPEPTLFLSTDSPQVPGGVGQLTWTAPAAAPGLLLVGLGFLDTLPQWEGPFWLDIPSATSLPIVAGAGPTTLDYRIPPDDDLIGTVITLQAAFPTVPGAQHPEKAATSNPTQLVIRF